MVVEAVLVRLVVVMLPEVRAPTVATLVALSWPLIVVEPSTASAEVVAWLMERMPPLTAASSSMWHDLPITLPGPILAPLFTTAWASMKHGPWRMAPGSTLASCETTTWPALPTNGLSFGTEPSVVFNGPSVYQRRNYHDIVSDMDREMMGHKDTLGVAVDSSRFDRIYETYKQECLR